MGLVLTNYLNLILSGAGVELREGERPEKRPGRYLVRAVIGLHAMNLGVRSAGSPILKNIIEICTLPCHFKYRTLCKVQYVSNT
jgi:hypothetical protein